MVSPEIQRTSIETYATGRGYEVVAWVEGIDESGSRDRSAWWPTLERAVADVEAGTYDVLVVWKFSRVARHRLKWATAIDRIEAAGGTIESATEQFDTTTSSGRLARGMVGELNAFMAEQIGESWKEAHARRVRVGKPHSGKPKWGYLYDREQKLHLPDPVAGPVLGDLYRRYVAGESFFSLARWLNAHGFRTSRDGLWRDVTLRRMMDSGFASGQFQHQGELHQGVHEPLITTALWQEYLDARYVRRAAPPRRERSQYLLSGLLRCARCGGPMNAGMFGSRCRVAKYRCKNAYDVGAEACVGGGYVTASYVEAAVKDWIVGLASAADESHQAALLARARRTTVRADAARLGRMVTRAEEALGRLVVQNAETPSPPGVYQAAHRELTEQLDELRAALEVSQREARGVVADPRREAVRLLGRWDTTPRPYLRTEIGKLLRCVMVTTGAPRASFVFVPAWDEGSL